MHGHDPQTAREMSMQDLERLAMVSPMVGGQQ